jgi:YopT peptidase
MNSKQTQMKTAAEACGGHMTYAFSQGQQLRFGSEDGADMGKLYKKVLRNGKEMGGACAAVSANWVAFHATQGSNHSFTRDRSVWDYLFTQGGLNLGAAVNIVIEHHLSSGKQINHFDDFLKKFGVIRRGEYTNPGANMESTGSFRAGPLVGRGIGEAIVARGEGYRMISLRNSSGGGGHMVGAWVAQDVMFMDPNYGEFWFDSRAKFLNWFARFWTLSGYSYNKVIARSYAQKVGKAA